MVEVGGGRARVGDRRPLGVARGRRPELAPHRGAGADHRIGDVDPRADTDWCQISDKALAVGGGVLEAVLTRLHGRT